MRYRNDNVTAFSAFVLVLIWVATGIFDHLFNIYMKMKSGYSVRFKIC